MPIPDCDELCLDIKNVSKSYRQRIDNRNEAKGSWQILIENLFRIKASVRSNSKAFFALNGVSLKVKKSESLGIIGQNGSGKSTLMQIIAGTLSPTSGEVRIKGNVAALLELGSGFNPEFTGKENVIINAKILGLSEDQLQLKMKRIESFADIGDFFNQPVRTYSSGMRVRLAFAVLVQVNPDILIIDEALAVGDARFKLKCFSFLREFKNKGGTLILVSHDLNSIARLCSQAVLLQEGCILAKGKPNDVINEYSRILSIDNNPNKRKFKRRQILDEEKNSHAEPSKEFSYGGEYAKILDIQLNCKDNKNVKVINSGKPFEVIFTVKAYEDIKDPIYAMTFKNHRGQQVYGQNSLFAKINTKSLKSGDKVEIHFKQYCNISAGDYFISIGLTRFEDEKLQIIHRRYDALEFKVINTDGSFGIANCYSLISVSPYNELAND